MAMRFTVLRFVPVREGPPLPVSGKCRSWAGFRGERICVFEAHIRWRVP